MRYTGFVSSAVLFIAVPLFAQNIEIPDPNFLKVLIERGVDTDSDGMISPTEAEAVTVLDVSGDTISDLTGLEYFIHLQHLDCSINYNLHLIRFGKCLRLPKVVRAFSSCSD